MHPARVEKPQEQIFTSPEKYNGEWMPAGGPVPMVLSGWVAHAGSALHLGSLTKGNLVANACTCGSSDTLVARPKDDNQN